MHIITDDNRLANLQAVYLDWVNNYLTIGNFAEDNNISVTDAEDLVNLGRNAHESIVQRLNDDRYTVKYSYMGDGMHNYQSLFNGEVFAYRCTEEQANAACEQYHRNLLSQITVK